MFRTLKNILPVAFIAVVFASCTKDNETDPQKSIPPAPGKGGDAALRIMPHTNGVNLDSAVIYIEYNAEAAPEDGAYDDSMRVFPYNSNYIVLFDNLYPGKYFIYGKGYNWQTSRDVTGGKPVEILSDHPSTTYNHTLTLQ